MIRQCQLQLRLGKGFTLIEIIVSISIVAFVLAVALTAQVTTNKAKDKLIDLSDLASELRYATEYIRHDLNNVFRGTIKEELIIEGQVDAGLEPTNSRLTIKTVDFQPIRKGYPESGLCEHEYYLVQEEGKSTLMRRRQPNVHAKGEIGGVVEPIAENIISFSVSYKADVNSEYIKEWPPEKNTAAPYMLEVVLSAKSPAYPQTLYSSFTAIIPKSAGGSQ